MMKCGTFEQLSSELCVFSNDWHAITNLKAIDTDEEWVDMRKKSTMSARGVICDLIPTAVSIQIKCE